MPTGPEPPLAVYPDPPEVQESDAARIRERSLAIIAACLPVGCLQVIALCLDGLAKERANGGLDVSLNTHEGRVLAADVSRRLHWTNRRAVKS